MECMVHRKQLLYGSLTLFFVITQLIWVGVPILMTVLWSLVDPHIPGPPDLFPQKLTWAQWHTCLNIPTSFVR
jgi:ABC-type maltose transport system permease subunit